MKTLSLPLQKFLWETRWNLPTILQGCQLLHWPNSIKINTSKFYLPVYLLWLPKIKILPRMRLPLFSLFLYPVHRKTTDHSSNQQGIISLASSLKWRQLEPPFTQNQNDSQDQMKFGKTVSNKLIPFYLGRLTWQDIKWPF